MRRRTPARRALFWLAIVVLALLALKGLLVVSQFIGYASVSSQAGTITELVIQHELPTEFWAGIYGVAVRVPGYTNQQYGDFTAGSMEETNLLFDCMQDKIPHEVYAIPVDPSTVDLSTLYPATPADIDAYFGKNESDYDSAANTYTQTISFNYGTNGLTVPGTVTYKLGEDPPTTFQIGIAKTANGTPVFVALITNFTDGFNGRLYNYQLLLPALPNATTRYYFFTDPHDTCPAGAGQTPDYGVVYGTVTTTTGIPVPGAIIEVAGVTNLTDINGNYSLVTQEGTHNIYAIKTGYKVYENNVTVVAGNATRHDIVLEEEVTPNTNTGIGPGIDNPGDNVGPAQHEGVGPGQDQGPGEAPPVVQQPKVIEGKDYIVSLTDLDRKLRLGQFLQETIHIYSFKKASAHVTLTINGTNISRLITSDKKEMTIDPNGNDQFVLTIFGVGDIGTYNGTIEIGGDLNATIPVSIEVLPSEQLPVEALHIQIDTAQKSYLPSDLVRFQTDLRNMLSDQQYPVHLLYTVQSPDGNATLWTYETNVFLQTAFSLIKSFQLPSATQPGDYILRVSATYLGLSSGTSTIFHVDVPFWERSFLGLRAWMWILILLGIGGIVAAVILIRRNIEAKKKYHLKVEYDELPKPGPRSVYVGKIAETDHTTYFNLENFKTHTIVAGSTGGGKSVSAQVIVEEALEKGVAVLVFDPTAQWTGMLRPCKDRTMLSLYPFFGMKPTDAKAFNGNIRQINDAREKIDIRKYVKPGEIQVFACHKLDPKDMDVLVANAIREIFHAGFPEEKLLKILFVFDEVHRLLPKFGGSGDGFLQIERACREFRKWGLGVLLISQVLSDFVGTIKANINTEIQMRTRDEGDLERIRQKYGEEVLRSLVKATVGSGMVENPAYNRGKPYFIAFKPLRHSVERLSDDEIEQYNTYNDQIDNLFFSLEQLEKTGVDVFDLKLELKLAQDKVKTGNFNMVKIYLEGLVPRIDKQWEKLGKKPQQLVRELVNMDEIKSELKKAQEERDKYVAAQQTTEAGAKGAGAKKEWAWKDDVAPDKILNLKNGMIVINLSSLYDEVSAMKDKDLPNEFDPEPKQEEGKPPKQPINRLAQWVLDATGDTKLGYAIAAAKTKDEVLQLLQLKKDGKPIPDAKPPAWFLKGAAGTPEPASPSTSPSASLPEAQPAAPSAAASAATSAAAPATAPPTVQTVPSSSVPPSTVSAFPPDRAPAGKRAEQPVPQPEGHGPSMPMPEQPRPGKKEREKEFDEWSREPPKEPAPKESPALQPVAAAKATGSLDALVVGDEQQAFRLENGVALHGIKELREYLPRMDDRMFRNHVGLDYNHFADWISGVFHDEALARKVSMARTKEALAAALGG